MKRFALLILIYFISFNVFAETINLKGGKTLEGKVLTRSDDHIQIDTGIGVPITYYLDEVDTINGEAVNSPDLVKNNTEIKISTKTDSRGNTEIKPMPEDIVLADEIENAENLEEWDPGQVTIKEEKFPNGNVKMMWTYKGKEYHGPVKEFYENGELKKSWYYQSGQFHGPVREYYENGQVQAEWYYRDGKKYGTTRKFNEDGSSIGEWGYKDGEYHGLVRDYFENGKVRGEWRYKDGKPHGKVIKFFDNGNQQGEWNYKDGLFQGLVQTNYPQGQMEYHWYFKDGQPHGQCLQFYPSGQLAEYVELVEGREEGKLLHFYPDGVLGEETEYKDGLNEGWSKHYNEEGVLINSSQYAQGKMLDEKGNLKNGMFQFYYPDSKVMMELEIKEGLPEGVYRYFDDKGSVVHEGYVNESDRKEIEQSLKGNRSQGPSGE